MENIRYSERMNSLNGSATREILKVVQNPEIISFAGGLPAPECLPIKDVIRISNEILTGPDVNKVLQYGTTDGLYSVREAAAKYAKGFGINISAENTLIISGGQQGIDLMCKAFLDKGDYILVEDPTYLATIQIAKSYQANIIGIKSDEDGINLEDLESKIKKYNPKLLYCVPTFSNPTGKTYPAEKRKKIAEITAANNVMVLEDDPYSKLRFAGEEINSLKSYDKAGNVVFVTSFSKIISPGLRIAVVIADKAVLRKLEICKQGVDVHTNHLSQAIVGRYLEEGLLENDLKRNVPIYGHKKNMMIKAMEKYMPEEFKYTNPDGGLFIWGYFTKPVDTVKMLPEAINNKVAYIYGQAFFADGSGLNTMRLNYSNSSDEKIDKGMRALAETAKKALAAL